MNEFDGSEQKVHPAREAEVNLTDIHINGGTQSRVAINELVVSEYAEAIQAGTQFPRVVLFNDGADNWLADGFHRYCAHQKAGKTTIAAEVRRGTLRDAKLHSLGANGKHGLRMTNADKHKAVETLLADPEWANWSDRKIAELCGVTHPFVASIRGPRVVTVTTSAAKKKGEQAGKVRGDAAATSKKLPPWATSDPAPLLEADDAREAVGILAAENERLADRLAVEAMDASEEEKTQAKNTIEGLRAEVKALTAELSAVKTSRDTYMREAIELKRQCAAQRQQLDALKVAE